MEYDSVLDLFKELSKRHTHQEIADFLGLHRGTISRWAEKDEVPKNYEADFIRILGVRSAKDSSKKDKDQYYTKGSVAESCFLKFKEVASDLNIDLSEYHYIEPSAGNGRFYDLLPAKRRIGIDIDPRREGLIKEDFLKWLPEKNNRYIVIGNPPFGLRGHLALQFINHSYDFADVVAFILPQLFNSDGKGSTKKRVTGYKLAYTEMIAPDSFEYPDGEEIMIHTIFQVWTKVNTDRIATPERKTCSDFVKIYSLSDGGKTSNTRNKDMIDKCDIYLPSTTYSGMKAYNSFYDLPHKRGYGVVIKKNKREIKKLLKENDWNKTAFSSSNSAVNLRKSLIENVIINAGHTDK